MEPSFSCNYFPPSWSNLCTTASISFLALFTSLFAAFFFCMFKCNTSTRSLHLVVVLHLSYSLFSSKPPSDRLPLPFHSPPYLGYIPECCALLQCSFPQILCDVHKHLVVTSSTYCIKITKFLVVEEPPILSLLSVYEWQVPLVPPFIQIA